MCTPKHCHDRSHLFEQYVLHMALIFRINARKLPIESYSSEKTRRFMLKSKRLREDFFRLRYD
ncbi:hypothetical protein BURKHO8Y_140012 [Burkholderia sp. 8Y]|nr:hypothetical protein BURKHO8Y_140012 [Burkholderia sp. 8Y]